MAEIRVENLHKSFGEFVAVKNSSFTVASGEFFVMLGPSGCGKTTTLRMIAGLELPSSGLIRLDGDDVTQLRASARDIAFVFQLFALYPHMNVRKNIAYPLANQGVAKPEIKTRVEEAARTLRIGHLLDRSVSGLSGGDRQRVALGRAIVRNPKAFLMDEPLGALDTELREAMIAELRALHDRLGATTLYVTHDQLEAMAMADKIAVMNKGVIEQFDTPQQIYGRPATLFVADFIGSPPMNLIPCRGPLAPGATTVQVGETVAGIPAVLDGTAATDLVLGVRPEQVQLVDEGGLRGEVFGAEYLGTTQIVTLRTGAGTVRARLSSAETVTVGAPVGLAFRPEKLSLFDKATGRALRTAWTVAAETKGHRRG
ncbi:ABC transporter ATP-binding protein [Prosthecomicrobium hirschii]|uniref:ABC transporter ATP-binding protein n=1 Tax=Prosthecodimorpha hirschii TaxID=665126 RepID=UPI001129E7B8|nr:ABC transporter ATP-binding protein [Prosthecomicrobium hirschii]TPQ49136.1 ABC transporter ATP-binding protein [Prosthecomicrobium hirschii]